MDDVTTDRRTLHKRIRRNALMYARYAARSPGWLTMFVFGRSPAIRALVARRPGNGSPELTPDAASVLEVDPQAVLDAVRSDGFYLGLKLPQALLSELCMIARTSMKDDGGAVSVVVDTLERKGRPCPAIEKLQADPRLRAIAAAYLNSRPVHYRSRMWWSFSRKTSLEDKLEYGQALLHCDLHDYRSIKFYFYLTDVDSSSGPHVCVRGTHLRRALKHQISPFVGQSERDIAKTYGRENIVTICGPAGFGFVEDPFCFHRGIPPESRDRLMLEIVFVRTHYLRKKKRRDRAAV